jgi:hypothetical protein
MIGGSRLTSAICAALGLLIILLDDHPEVVRSERKREQIKVSIHGGFHCHCLHFLKILLQDLDVIILTLQAFADNNPRFRLGDSRLRFFGQHGGSEEIDCGRL